MADDSGSKTPIPETDIPDTGAEEPKPDIVAFAAALVAAAIILAALYYGRDIFIPLATAFLISFALNPPVSWLARRGLPRVVATLVTMSAVLIVVSGLGFLLAAEVRTLAAELPTYQTTMLRKLSGIRETLSAPGVFSRALKTIERMQEEVVAPPSAARDEPPVPRVEVIPVSQTPFEQAFKWLARAAEPLTVAGIILIFVFLALIDRTDLRDRLLRLLGGNVHRSTESMEEAGARVSRYLLMQIAVNVTYGIPMALGLWFIGVPGALLWGCMAAVLRFVPYLGPMISAIFPLALAFATDSGWSMVLWALGLIVTLELISNNIVEPMLYGSSTGLSAISLITAAMFWTALWGPVGLILSTPLTVCLLVFGRSLPQLQFLDTLLGSTPVLDLPTRIYQRLIAGDPEEAVELAEEKIAASSLRSFYNDVGINVLRRASEDHLRNATAAHRLRFATGMDTLLDELMEEIPPPTGDAPAQVVCIGGKWDVDAIAARIVAHALALEGLSVEARPAATVNRHYVEQLELIGTEILCLSYFTDNPLLPARHFIRRLRIRWPKLQIVLAFWKAPAELLEESVCERLGAQAVVNSVDEAVRRIHRILAPEEAREAQQAEVPQQDAERVAALQVSGLLDGKHREAFDALAKRAADVFNARIAVISTIDDEREFFVGQSGNFPEVLTDESGALLSMARRDAICNYVVGTQETLVIPDIDRDPRFADNEAIKQWGVRFYAGSAIRSQDGFVFGAFCILDDEPRSFEPSDVELLEKMAAEVGAAIADGAVDAPPSKAAPAPASATVGQRLPK